MLNTITISLTEYEDLKRIQKEYDDAHSEIFYLAWQRSEIRLEKYEIEKELNNFKKMSIIEFIKYKLKK